MPYTPRQMALLAEWTAIMAAKIKETKQRRDRAADYDDYIPASNELMMLKWRLGGHVGFSEWAECHSDCEVA